MCRFKIDKTEFAKEFSCIFDQYFQDEEAHIRYCIDENLLSLKGDCLETTELGKIFIRNICMGFDWYLRQTKTDRRFSKIV